MGRKTLKGFDLNNPGFKPREKLENDCVTG